MTASSAKPGGGGVSATDRALTEDRGPRVRTAILRTLIAVIAVLLLVCPVGIQTGTALRRVGVGEALFELAAGRLGVGILSGLVAGGGLAKESLLRLGLVAASGLAYLLAGVRRHGPEPVPEGRRACPHCGRWMSVAMADGPSCGRPVA